MRYDKRKLERLDIFLIVEFKPLQNMGGGTTGITRDLTTEGFSMEAQSIDCKSGDILEFRLKHPGAHQDIVLSGEVVWKNHSWYKYVVGVKFLEVSKEQRTAILKLMSGVKDVTTAAGPGEEDPGTVPEIEKREEQAFNQDPEKEDETGPDTSETSGSGTALEASGHEEPEDPEENSMAADDAGKVDVKSSVTDAAEVMYDNVSPAAEGQKKKVWLYVPLAAVVIVILLIAVPAMIENFNHASRSVDARLSGPESSHNGEKVIPAPEGDIIKGNNEDLTLPEAVPDQDIENDIPTRKDAMEHASGDVSADGNMNADKTAAAGLSEDNQSASGPEQEVNEKEEKNAP